MEEPKSRYPFWRSIQTTAKPPLTLERLNEILKRIHGSALHCFENDPKRIVTQAELDVIETMWARGKLDRHGFPRNKLESLEYWLRLKRANRLTKR